MEEYSVTFGYKAVLSVNVKADNEKEAIEKANKEIEKMRGRIASSKLSLEDDSYRSEADGVVNLDKTWNQL